MRSFLTSNDSGADYNSHRLDKTIEMKKGMLAMLPNWTAYLKQGKTVYDSISVIDAVIQRQQLLSQCYLWPGVPDKADEVNKVRPMLFIAWVMHKPHSLSQVSERVSWEFKFISIYSVEFWFY